MQPRWQKLGNLYCPTSIGAHPKLLSHAANPLPVQLTGDIYRVFFSGRDSQNRSSVGAVDLDIVRRQIVRTHHAPFATHGPDGSFYAAGISIGNCYATGNARYMLFMGWQNPAGGHWRGDIGRLRMNDDLTLDVTSAEALMGSDATDPISLSYPWVLRDEHGRYHMWYGSTLAWDAGNGEMLHVIHYAESGDGHRWNRRGAAVPHPLGVAQAFSRPTVAGNRADGYHMWFSYRSGTGTAYRIGYATSTDGRNWALDLENAGIAPSEHGWDANMVEYPYVFDHSGERYMLYNGDQYGRTGFGLAVLRGE